MSYRQSQNIRQPQTQLIHVYALHQMAVKDCTDSPGPKLSKDEKAFWFGVGIPMLPISSEFWPSTYPSSPRPCPGPLGFGATSVRDAPAAHISWPRRSFWCWNHRINHNKPKMYPEYIWTYFLLLLLLQMNKFFIGPMLDVWEYLHGLLAVFCLCLKVACEVLGQC